VLAALHRRAERRKVQEKKANAVSRQRMTTVRGPTNSEVQDPEGGSRASSTRTNREQVNQPGGDRILPAGQGSKTMIRLEEIPIHALGEMDGSTVAWIVDQTLRNPQAQRQFGKAAWALTSYQLMARPGRST